MFNLKFIIFINLIYSLSFLNINFRFQNLNERIDILNNLTEFEQFKTNIMNLEIFKKTLFHNFFESEKIFKNNQNDKSLFETNIFLLYVHKIYILFKSTLIYLNDIKNTNLFEIIDYDYNDLLITIRDFTSVYNKENLNIIFITNINNINLQNFYQNYSSKLCNSLNHLKTFIYKLDEYQGMLSFFDKEKYELLFNKFNILREINEIRNNILTKTNNTYNKSLECIAFNINDFNNISNDVINDFGLKFLKNNFKCLKKKIKFSFIIDDHNLNQEVNNLILSMNELENVAEDIDNSNILTLNNVYYNKLKYKNAVTNFLNYVKIFFEAIYSKSDLFNGISYFNDYGIFFTLNILKNKLDTENNYKEKVNYIFKKLLSSSLEEEEKNTIFKIYCDKKYTYLDLSRFIQILDIGYRVLNFQFYNNEFNLVYFNNFVINDFKSKIDNYMVLIILLNLLLNPSSNNIISKDNIKMMIFDKIIEILFETNFITTLMEQSLSYNNFKFLKSNKQYLKYLFGNILKLENEKDFFFTWIINDILKILAFKIIYENEILFIYSFYNIENSNSLKNILNIIFNIYNYNIYKIY